MQRKKAETAKKKNPTVRLLRDSTLLYILYRAFTFLQRIFLLLLLP